jgi:hypothetical protein
VKGIAAPQEKKRGSHIVPEWGMTEKETNESTTMGKLHSDTGFSHFMQF